MLLQGLTRIYEGKFSSCHDRIIVNPFRLTRICEGKFSSCHDCIIVNPFPGCSLHWEMWTCDRTRSRARSLSRLCVWTWGVSLPLVVPRYS